MQADSESCELLRAIARSANAEQIHSLAGMIRDWDSLLGLAEEHRVLPMLFLRLVDMGSAVPPSVQEHLRTEYERNMFHCLANAVELVAVLKALECAIIPAMPFKGVVLGASAYRDLTTRPAGDLDVLIHHRHLAQSTTILLKRGYELETAVGVDGAPINPDYYEYRFARQTDGMVIELRWRFELIQPKFKRNLGMDWVWPQRRTTILAGAEVPDMSPESTLLMLCMHGSKHVWGRLIWILDVTQLLASSPELDWGQVIGESKKSGLRRTLALGVLLAHRVTGATVPEAALQWFESDTTASNLAQHIEENLFDAPYSTSVGHMPYGLQILDFCDRVRWLLSPDLLRPNERDWAVVPLPKPLHALYYLIRPIRILWDKSAR
jgi:Uncharacterised nucleotidyltransferase